MTTDEFNLQMERLTTTWPSSYPPEKVKLIWTAVHQQSKFWFENLVTDSIASNARAPLPQEFIDAASKQDKSRFVGSLPNSVDQIHPSTNSIFSKEDIREMITVMKKRMNGEISFEECRRYEEIIRSTLNQRNL